MKLSLRRIPTLGLVSVVALAAIGRVIVACAESDEVLGNELPQADASGDGSITAPPPPSAGGDAATDAGSSDADGAAPTCTTEGWCYTALPANDSYDASTLPPSATGISYPMRAVWVAPDNRVWAVTDVGHLLRFDGTSWRVIDVVGNASFKTIWGTSATDLWIGGERGIIYRATVGAGDAVTFQRITIGTTQTIGRILGTGPNDVWAIADGQGGSGTLNRVWRYTNGPAFASIPVPSSFTHSSSRIRVQALWLSGTTNQLWVSGYETTSCGPIACKFQSQLVAAKWNGGPDGGTPAWQHVPLLREYSDPVADAVPSPDGVFLLAVRGPGDEARTVRIAEDNAKLDAGAADPLFDGGVSGIHDEGQYAWTSELAHTYGSPNAIYASSANDVWLAGKSGVIRHFDGKEWKLVPLSLSRVTPLLLDLYGISVRGDDMWVVGDDVALRRKVKP